MGLRCSFSVDSIGLPEYLEDDEYGIIVDIDYSSAFDAFVDTFLEISNMLVPVDTGYLKSTLSAYSDDYECVAITNCEYAQYPEFGTIYQSPQPYFTPAIEDAWAAFVEEAIAAVEDAEIEFEDLIEEAMEEEMEEEMEAFEREQSMPRGMMGSFGDTLMGVAIGAALFILLFPILVNIYGIIRTLADGITGGSSRGGVNINISSSFADINNAMPEIEII